MNKKFLIKVSVVSAAAATLTLSACGGGGGSTTPAQTGKPAATEAPVAPAAPAAPTTVQGKPVAQFYSETCAPCHGAKREGVVGPALTPAKLTQADDFYANTIKNGRPGTAMAGFANLSDNDIKALVNFIKNTQP